MLHVLMVQKVGHALSNVVKELHGRKRRKQMRSSGKDHKSQLEPHAVLS